MKNVNQEENLKIGYSKENQLTIQTMILDLTSFWAMYAHLRKKISCCTRNGLNEKRKSIYESNID